MTVRMVTIDYPDGNRIAVRVDDPPVNARAKAMVDEFLNSLTPGERETLVLLLAEEIHETKIYERVCARKGLLPL